MNYTVEKKFITKAGFIAAIIMTSNKHRCGYVGIPPSHLAFGKNYQEQLDCISNEDVDNCSVGKKYPILILTATCRADTEDSIRRSIDILIDVHGGVTYSGGSSEYPVKTEEKIWWFGFDCAHYGDDKEGGQSLEYCVVECESMATQLQELSS